jgi:hypothetical protein
LEAQLPEHQVDAPVHGDLFIEMIVVCSVQFALRTLQRANIVNKKKQPTIWAAFLDFYNETS